MQHEHEWEVARVRGHKRRDRCKTCLVWGRWRTIKPVEVSHGHTITELRSMAREKGLSGYSRATKPALMEMLGIK